MHIEWNKVTWYSKLLAAIIFTIVLVGGFYIGIKTGYLVGYTKASNAATATIQRISNLARANSTIPEYYSNPLEWADDQRDDAGFTIKHPLDFDIQDNYSVAPTGDWRTNAAQKGILFLRMTVPKTFEPQSNFAGAYLTVGASRNDVAVAQCLAAGTNPSETAASSSIVGIPFSMYTSSEGAAGTIYQTTSYRVLHAGQCYAIEYTIMSSELGVWPASYNFHAFDQTKIEKTLDRIVQTFSFE